MDRMRMSALPQVPELGVVEVGPTDMVAKCSVWVAQYGQCTNDMLLLGTAMPLLSKAAIWGRSKWVRKDY